MMKTRFRRLRLAGIEPGDPPALAAQKRLLVFISGLVSAASIAWLLIYWALGPRLSATLPFLLQVLIAANLALYLGSGKFVVFRTVLLSLLLFFPFVAQWSIGDFVSASGLILWGLLAPIVAMLCLGGRASLPWFAAYLILTLVTGIADFLLAGSGTTAPAVPRHIVMVFFALNFATISSLVYLVLRHALHEREQTRLALESAHQKLSREQRRSEQILANILPDSVARRLKHSEETIADWFPNVTVMFADIVNFTELASRLHPAQLFAMLNRIFSQFDDIAQARGLERIKTIGDAYMAAGGLYEGCPDPATATADMALAMSDWLASDPECQAYLLRLRIGIGTGPVVAGIIGKKRFIYDLWGDTVNLASRLTGEGPAGSIHCDTTTHALLRDDFLFSEPLSLPVKGKGTVMMWRLAGRITRSAGEAEAA